MPPILSRAAPVALTLAVAALGGVIFLALDFPAPWLSGGTLAVGALTLARRGADLPDLLVAAAMVLLGASMGVGVTPTAVSQAMTWPGSLLGLAISVFAIVGFSVLFLWKVAGWDRDTALYASIPGAMPVVMLMAAESNANVPRVAIAQVLRVFILVALMPSLVSSVGEGPVVVQPAAAGTWAEFLLVILLCPIGGYIAQRLRIPAGMLMGSFAVSAALHLSEIAVAPLPAEVVVLSFIVLGALVGRRFSNVRLRELPAVLVPAFGAFIVATGSAIASAWVVSRLLGLPLEQVFLAYVPGALETMILMAFALGIDPVYVSVHQLARFVGLALLLPVFVKRRNKPDG
jgi:membrane AbrB-like protein